MKIGQRAIYTTTKEKAYRIALLSSDELSREELKVFRTSDWGNPSWWDKLVEFDTRIHFKGRIINIHKHSNGWTLITVRFDNGKEIGFTKGISDKGLRPAIFGL